MRTAKLVFVIVGFCLSLLSLVIPLTLSLGAPQTSSAAGENDKGRFSFMLAFRFWLFSIVAFVLGIVAYARSNLGISIAAGIVLVVSGILQVVLGFVFIISDTSIALCIIPIVGGASYIVAAIFFLVQRGTKKTATS